MEKMNKRIFIAVNFPDELKKEIFESISSELPKDECKIVAEANLHITLKFLGYLNEEKIAEIKNISVSDLAEITSQNARNLFHLDP